MDDDEEERNYTRERLKQSVTRQLKKLNATAYMRVHNRDFSKAKVS